MSRVLTSISLLVVCPFHMPSSLIDILESHRSEDDIETRDIETEEGEDVDLARADEGEDSDIDE